MLNLKNLSFTPNNKRDPAKPRRQLPRILRKLHNVPKPLRTGTRNKTNVQRTRTKLQTRPRSQQANAEPSENKTLRRRNPRYPRIPKRIRAHEAVHSRSGKHAQIAFQKVFDPTQFGNFPKIFFAS